MKSLLETPVEKRRRALAIGLFGVALVLYGVWLLPGKPQEYQYRDVDELPEAVYAWLSENDAGNKFEAVNHGGRTYMIYDAGVVSNYKVRFKKITRRDENTVDVTMYAGPDRKPGSIMDMGSVPVSRTVVLSKQLKAGTTINLHFSDKDEKGRRLRSESDTEYDYTKVGRAD